MYYANHFHRYNSSMSNRIQLKVLASSSGPVPFVLFCNRPMGLYRHPNSSKILEQALWELKAERVVFFVTNFWEIRWSFFHEERKKKQYYLCCNYYYACILARIGTSVRYLSRNRVVPIMKWRRSVQALPRITSKYTDRSTWYYINITTK